MILIDTDHLSVLSNHLARGHPALVRRMAASADQECDGNCEIRYFAAL